MKSILEQFEKMCVKFPDKTLYADTETSISFSNFKNRCQEIASHIAKKGIFNRPIAVIDSRDVGTLIGMFSVVYSGNHYVVLDGASPKERLKKICDCLNPSIILCQEKSLPLANSLAEEYPNCQALNIENLKGNIDEKILQSVRERQISTDLAYILFTSGSTGTPKGTAVTHANVMAYIEWFASEFEIDERTVFASQTPFYFSASVSDIYSSLMFGATLNIIPKSYFTFPIQLVRFLNECKVNTIYWVPSALCIVANIDLFKYEKPRYLKKVMFVGEIMPNKQLSYWRKWLPNVKFANLFGPTEVVDICTFYKVDRAFEDDERLPIGKHCNNARTFIIDENGKEVTTPGVIGELYVQSQFVAMGYYNNDEQTKKAFVQNPLHNHYPEIVYKTGDLVMLNEFGEYEYMGRKDFQIKHKGYRIELGEIERVAGAISRVSTVAALYDDEQDKIVLVYSGKIKESELYEILKNLLPEYMLPEVLIALPSLPLNQNGKIDRKYLIQNYISLAKGE